MENENGAVILLIVLIVSAFLLLAAKFAMFIARFNRETKYIIMEINRAADSDEYRYWRRELRCHYLCLIPFVTERNVAKVYDFFFHRPKHAEKKSRSDGFFHIIAPLFIGSFLCAVCLCGASWAWFTASFDTGTVKIQSADYSVSVTTRTDEAEPVAATADENGVYEISLESGKKYTIVITAGGTATTGYCTVQFGEQIYHTVQLYNEPDAQGPNSVTFTATPTESAQLIITPQWGTYNKPDSEVLIGKSESDISSLSLITIQSLNLLSDETVQTDAAEKTEYRLTDTEQSYIVQSGDTLSTIANQYGTTVAVLAAYNNIQNVKSIQAGKTLKIPPISYQVPEPTASQSSGTESTTTERTASEPNQQTTETSSAASETASMTQETVSAESAASETTTSQETVSTETTSAETETTEP